ncbi:MAG: CDP-glycerol glycerophosphotransferase family protein [Ruminococcus flavefaciens]|nr:CDP-glycerol glycerophosphotransferase family protein [Ruminococcus flavefaciens]
MGNQQKGSISENIYIVKRKLKAFLQSIAYYVCRIFPIDKRKVVIWTFECGGGYGCSPKYVAEEILKRNREKTAGFRVVWLMNDISREMPQGIQKVKNTLWKRAYHMATAGTWIGNSRTFYGTKKRKRQRYIQTWHATVCIKPIGKYRGDLFPKMAYIVSEADSKLIDYVLSGSAWCDHMYRDGLIYNGEIIKTGTPRCDILIRGQGEKHRQMRREYHIPQDAKIMLYAPTFRGGSQNKSRTVNMEETVIDFEKLIDALEQRFGGVWYIFLRLHPQLAALMQRPETGQVSERLIDVTQRPDMNEIIAGTDAFLTDYSSAVFEAALTGQPGFLYADDLEEYIADRGDLFFDMYRLPFPVARNNDELMENILKFDEKEYQRQVGSFIEEVGMFEDGNASVRVADLIEQIHER